MRTWAGASRGSQRSPGNGRSPAKRAFDNYIPVSLKVPVSLILQLQRELPLKWGDTHTCCAAVWLQTQQDNESVDIFKATFIAQALGSLSSLFLSKRTRRHSCAQDCTFRCYGLYSLSHHFTLFLHHTGPIRPYNYPEVSKQHNWHRCSFSSHVFLFGDSASTILRRIREVPLFIVPF